MKKQSKKKTVRKSATEKTRGYAELVGGGSGINADWAATQQSEDADMFANAWALTSRSRDLARTNTTFQRYRELVWCAVFGEAGTMLRAKAKEQEDRVIHTPEEKAAIRAFEERRNRVFKYCAEKEGRAYEPQNLIRELGSNGTRIAQIKVGEPDVFANQLIERKWREWHRPEFCDVRGTKTYAQIRQLRLWHAIRDGDHFIHLISNPKVNKFGFTLRLINSEWCDRFLNQTLDNGNVIRMGIEYGMNTWGIGKPVAYHFIKRQPRDWQFSIGGSFGYRGGQLHERIPAEEIIHYARPVDAEQTRPAPWIASTIPKARQLDQYMLAEVVAARAQACKVGYLYSDINPDGGAGGMDVNPADSLPTQQLSPGDIFALKYGVKYGQTDPTHPNGNAEAFRMMMLRDQSAGMPACAYSELASDYSSINFSAGRLQRLTTDGMSYMIQRFDIDRAEIPIFEAWLYMALLTGEIPLPVAKFQKFNAKQFQGPRTPGVDEIKQVTAAALRVANHFSSDQRECDLVGVDFEEVLFEQAEANMLKESLGIGTLKTVETPLVASQVAADPDEDDATETPPAKPAKKTFAKRR